jgi:iron complex outermembrane receptor protein
VLDATAFDTTTENFQAQTVQNVNGVTSFVFANADELKARGFQVNAYAQATEDLSFTAGLLYNKAEYGDFIVQCNAPFLAGCTTTTAGPTINVNGRQLAGAPEWKLVGSVNYDFRLADRFDAFVQANGTYRSEVFTSATPDPNLQIDGYTRVDGRIGIRGPDERWTLALFAKNLFDEVQPAIIFRDPLQPLNNYDQAFGFDSVRVVGVSLDVRY